MYLDAMQATVAGVEDLDREIDRYRKFAQALRLRRFY